jgi:hypothetical protein
MEMAILQAGNGKTAAQKAAASFPQFISACMSI